MFQIYGTQEAYQVFDIKAIFKSLVEDWPPVWNSDVVFSFKEPWIYSNSIEKSQANFKVMVWFVILNIGLFSLVRMNETRKSRTTN